MKVKNIVSISGGKDSTALLLLAKEKLGDDFIAVFADTGHEHKKTYEYVNYLSENVFPTQIVKADFSKEIERKRNYVKTKWVDEGIDENIIINALSVLQPSGNPFLDLCLWKGRFPSTRARFCSSELKHNPIFEQIVDPLLEDGFEVISWQGVRADESLARRDLQSIEEVGGGLWNYRPILDWTAEDVFKFHDKHNVKPNPLYKLGMGRVGCMPCIHARKAEIREIFERFPEEIERVRQWEIIVSQASKRGASSFFGPDKTGGNIKNMSHKQAHEVLNIDNVVEWSKTARGGKVMDLIAATQDFTVCSSIYGLCE